MPQYTVKAPDGKTITLEGPEGASEADIISQAQALYKPQTAAPKPAAPKPAAKPAPTKAAPANPYVQQYGKKDPKTVLRIYQNARQQLAAGISDPTKRDAALKRFDSDPRAQAMRQVAGLAPVSTRKQEVAAVAKKSLRQSGAELGENASGFQSAAAGIRKGLFGIPDMLAAAGVRYLPSAITGNNTDASYSNILEMIRGKTDAEIGANYKTGLVGEVGGAIVSGNAARKAIAGTARRLAATASPALARVGNVLEGLTTLQKGRRAANAAKIATAGAAAGGAQAAGTGGDVVTGAVTGAVAAPLLVGGLKLGQVVTRPFRDVLRLSSAGQILSRLTTATRDQLERRAAEYRNATGAEPTLFELLPLADRNKILKTAVVGKDNVVEQTSDAIRARARNLGPEMSARARQILQPQRDFIERGIRRDMTAARGGQLLPEDDALIRSAMDNPTDMLRLRDEEARAIMAPHDATRVVDNLEDLFPQAPGVNGGNPISLDPEVAAVIRSAAGTLRQRATGAGVTAGDITDMISTLRGDLGRGGIEGRNAQRAIEHLQDTLDDLAPDAGAAARQMSDAYAARSRMAEGMQEGAQTRLRSDVQVGTSRTQARKVRNAYDTPEGSSGRSVGQSNKIITDLGGSPEEALRATVKQSRGSTTRPLAQNLGPVEADLLGAAARAQDESAQALAAASQKAQGGSGDGADAEMLVQAIAGLHPSSFITTKAGAMRKLLDMTYIPESRARTMVDMLFSQDPAMMQRALRAIGNEPNGVAAVRALTMLAGRAAGDATTAGGLGLPEGTGEVTVDENSAPSVEDDLTALEEPATDEEPIDVSTVGGDSPYAAELQRIYQTENPDLIDLIQRVKKQESGGDQSAVSSAGAIGVMQVMPETAPEAAELAGVEWDEDAYHNDAAYNEILGIAYLSMLLRKYDGDVSRALAAYNAGPGRVDDALQMHDAAWLGNLPAETQDYVARVG